MQEYSFWKLLASSAGMAVLEKSTSRRGVCEFEKHPE
jgi:hypothetical protein